MLFIVTLHDQRISYSNPYFLLDKLVLFPQEFARHSPFIITRILSMQDGSSTISSQRSRYRRIFFLHDHVFIEEEFFFMEHSNFKVFPLIRRRLGVATLLQESIRSSSVERVSIVNTDAILESGFRLWYSQVAPSIRPRLTKHDNNSFPRKISSTTELYSNVKTVFTILIRK